MATALTCGILTFLFGGAASAAYLSVLGGLTREVTLAPGARYESRIVLSNGSGHAQEVRVYQTDYLFFADGRNEYGEPGTAPRSNAQWITFTPRDLIVPPGDTASIYYVIQVPGNSTLVGTYWSMLMVEPLGTDSLEPLAPEECKAKVGLRTVVRYGIQMTTHVGTAGTRDLQFGNLKLVREGDKRLFRLDVGNVGEQCLNPTFWVEVHDQEGARVGRFEAPKARLYPGCSVCCQFDLSALAVGTYNALVVADNEDDNVFGAQCKLEIR